MKLFIWADPYSVNYGTSALFAVAETEDEAIVLAASAPTFKYVQYAEESKGVSDFEALKKMLGKPTRVVDLPCAEWHEWSE